MAEQEKQQPQSESSNLWEVIAASLLILALLGVVALLYWGSLRFRAEMYHSNAAQALSQGNIDEAQRLETQAVNLASFEDRYHRVLSQIYLSKINRVMNNDELGKKQKRSRLQNLMGRVVNHAQRATQISKRNVANWANRGLVYRTLMSYAVQGADKQAKKSYNKAIELSPTNPRLYTQLARVYINESDLAAQAQNSQLRTKKLNKAEQKLNKSIELRPNYWPAHFQLGTVYWREQELDKAQRSFNQALTFNPNLADARYFLGLIYDRQNKKQQAIEQFEKIASLSEENEQRVANILKRLRAGKSALKKAQTSQQPQQIPELEGEENSTTTAPQQ